MKLYEFSFTEYNGGQEYSESRLVHANNIVEAECKAMAYLSTWYNDDDVVKRGGTFEYFCGDIVVEFNEICEMRRPKYWSERRFKENLIGE